MRMIAWLFFLVALAAALASYGFTTKTKTTSTQGTTTTRELPNGVTDQTVHSDTSSDSKNHGALAFGIISAACFVGSALLFSKDASNKKL